jgi:hypothetical protein
MFMFKSYVVHVEFPVDGLAREKSKPTRRDAISLLQEAARIQGSRYLGFCFTSCQSQQHPSRPWYCFEEPTTSSRRCSTAVDRAADRTRVPP